MMAMNATKEDDYRISTFTDQPTPISSDHRAQIRHQISVALSAPVSWANAIRMVALRADRNPY